jgi:hypothetical protein
VIRIHRDKYDPGHSFANFVLHGLTRHRLGRCSAEPSDSWAATALIEGG